MIATTPSAGFVQRTNVQLRPDSSRVVNQLFIAGEDISSATSRANPLLERVLALSDAEVEPVLADVLRRFEDRHLDFASDLLDHFDQISDRLGAHGTFSVPRRMLLGAYFTHEYSVEAAALCNPSIVAHPDQDGLDPGELRFVLSLRAVGEGHLSSVEFRTGVVGADDVVRVDDPGKLLVSGRRRSSTYQRDHFRSLASRPGRGEEIVALVLETLPPVFSGEELEAALHGLQSHLLSRREGLATVERIRHVASSNYTVAFPANTSIGQRVLRPLGPTESHGIEDARFVRFRGDDGAMTYYATYTAFDGAHVAPQLLQTDDFETFRVSQLEGRAATNKGMALFPRLIGGRYVALSRWDRECNAVTTSVDARRWDDPVQVQSPEQPWELIQIGNCGSPIETAAGWVVLTHGVGPMRTYSLGAILLDLEDPTIVRGKLTEPLLSPGPNERDGYVPNVLYTCGALLHRDTIVVPYAYGDSQTSFAVIALGPLLEALLAR